MILLKHLAKSIKRVYFILASSIIMNLCCVLNLPAIFKHDFTLSVYVCKLEFVAKGYLKTIEPGCFWSTIL